MVLNTRLGDWVDNEQAASTHSAGRGFVPAVDEVARSLLPRENRAYALPLDVDSTQQTPPLALNEELLLLSRRTLRDTVEHGGPYLTDDKGVTPRCAHTCPVPPAARVLPLCACEPAPPPPTHQGLASPARRVRTS